MLPESFGDAHIQYMKKTAASALALDHRPIALLNSDYKLFTNNSVISSAATTLAHSFASPSWILPKEFNSHSPGHI